MDCVLDNEIITHIYKFEIEKTKNKHNRHFFKKSFKLYKACILEITGIRISLRYV